MYNGGYQRVPVMFFQHYRLTGTRVNNCDKTIGGAQVDTHNYFLLLQAAGRYVDADLCHKIINHKYQITNHGKITKRIDGLLTKMETKIPVRDRDLFMSAINLRFISSGTFYRNLC